MTRPPPSSPRKPHRMAWPAAALAALLLAACGDRAPAPAADADAPAATGDASPAPADAPAPDAAPPGDAAPAAPAGEPEVPALATTDIDGKPWDLAQRRGKWVVVNFWATWCSPCLKEMPELSALDAMREDVEVVGLAYEDTTPDDLRAFLRERPVVYPIAIVDVTAPPADFATPRGLPMTYLVAPDGRVAKKFLGPVTAAEIEAVIAGAGGEAPKPAAGAEA